MASGPGTAGAKPSHSFVIWLILISILLPASMTFQLGESKFYPARLVILVLLLPALACLLRKGRHVILSDWFALATSAWIIGTTFVPGRESSLSSAAAVVLEFLGGYVVARGFIVGREALGAFVQALKFVVVTMVTLALLEHLTGRIIANEIVSAFWGAGLTTEAELRHGLVRANSIFPHPILYGTFCVVAGAIFLCSERDQTRHIFYVALAFFGCLLAMSSAPLLSFMVVLFAYSYAHLMKSYSWRWKILLMAIGAIIIVIMLVTENPTSWIVAHLTLDPSTGYFRQATWDRALYNIDLSPLVGYGFEGLEDRTEFFDKASVDCVWLVLALRFGAPVVLLLLLTNVTSFYGFGRKTSGRGLDPYMDNMRMAFTLTLVTFMLAGLTVHYWNTVWMVWGLCIGIRASLQEQLLGSRHRSDQRSLTPRMYVHGRAQVG